MKTRLAATISLPGVVLLAACAGIPPGKGPAAPQAQSAAAPPSGLRARATANPAALPAAALALARDADAAAARHDWPRASRALERALQIAPDNPLLWQRLAAVRYSQGRYRQAETWALKSNALAQGDRRVQALNERIIAAARRALGDPGGAAAATQRTQAH